MRLVRGDIAAYSADAIVNAANSSLLGGGGVDGAIHSAGGPEIMAECRRLREERFPKGLPSGQAVATTAGRLPAQWVIHTVGPVYSPQDDRSDVLASSYRESLRVADDLGARSVAFPAISAGAFSWPIESAARTALETVVQADTQVTEVTFVLYDQAAYRAFQRQAQRLGVTVE
nr:O-acetyl-ADP-ribose deacetylase [Haloglycomyces albus]